MAVLGSKKRISWRPYCRRDPIFFRILVIFMSLTPLTDEADDVTRHFSVRFHRVRDLCCKLERELVEARSENGKLTADLMGCRDGALVRDLCAALERAERANAELIERCAKAMRIFAAEYHWRSVEATVLMAAANRIENIGRALKDTQTDSEPRSSSV